jgi:predicted metal-dependent phosphoesterase TrpH
MVVADLHVHTTNSDGTLTLETLPEAAREAGVEMVAVTDHDRLHPDLTGPVTTVEEVTVIHGIELRVEREDRRVDLLGYGATETPRVRDLVDRIQRNRVQRGREIIERVEAHIDVTLDVEPREGIGRPHIARAIERSDADIDYQGAFDELIGNDGPCYVRRDVPAFREGVKTLSDACRVVGLAHPFRYDDPEWALTLTQDLDAVERWYPYGRPVDTGLLDDAVERHDLVCTGGSDAHEETLGVAGLDREQFAQFEAAMGL